MKNIPVFSPTHIRNVRFSLRRHVRHRLLTSQVGMVQVALAPCLSSWPERFAAALLVLWFADIVPFILALILVAYDSYVAFSNVRENSTDFETDGVSEGRSIASPSSSARRVQSRTEFAKLGNVE